jgi:hypothetical protein
MFFLILKLRTADASMFKRNNRQSVFEQHKGCNKNLDFQFYTTEFSLRFTVPISFSPHKLVPAEKHETPHFPRLLFRSQFNLSATKQQPTNCHSFSVLLNSIQHDATYKCKEYQLYSLIQKSQFQYRHKHGCRK